MMRGVTKALPYLLLAPALLPLVYTDGLLYPFVASKTLLLRGLGIVLLAAFAFLALSGKPFFWHRLRAKAAWIPGALLVVAYATSFFGIDFYHSFWSVFDRGDGLLTFTIVGVFFYILLLWADRSFFERLCRVVAWAGSLAALYACLQWVQGTTGVDIPIIAEPNGRYGGTLGNAAFLAAYLGMTFFVTLIVAPLYRRKWQKALYVGAGLQLFAIIISATRGTLLALIAAGSVALAYNAWKGEGRMRTYGRIGLAALIIAAGLFVAFRSQLTHAPFEPVRRIASVSLADGTVSSRLFVWQHMLTEALKRPVTGYGAEHIDIPFNGFYDPSAIDEQWFDRSHNVFLDYFVQYGILGLASYLGLILAFAWTAFARFREGDRHGGLLFLLILTYAIQNFFVFDTAMTLWLFLMLFAALIAVHSDAKESKLKLPAWWPSWTPAVIALSIALLVIPVSLQPLRANLLLASGYRYHIVDVRRAVDSMQKGLALGTYADLEYGYQAYQMYTDRQVTMLSGEARIIAYRYAADVLEKDFERYPYDARTATYYAHVLDSAPPEVAIDEAKLKDVIARAVELSPKRMQPWYLLANISLKKGDRVSQGPEKESYYREGIRVLEEYSAIVPRFAEPRYVIATLFLSIDENAEAKKWADEALPLYKTDAAVAKRASRYYINVEDWPNAARFMEDVVRDDPGNFPLQYDLAKTKWLAGDREGARQIVEKLKTDAPGLFESDPAFVKEYEAR